MRLYTKERYTVSIVLYVPDAERLMKHGHMFGNVLIIRSMNLKYGATHLIVLISIVL
jgi:hypothetical protein